MKTLIAAAIVLTSWCGAAAAQSAETSYKADPDVYKVIFEDADFRVIEGTRKAGARDKLHSHPQATVVYNATDCKTKQYMADGKVIENERKAGSVIQTASGTVHSAENTGTADCKQIFVEKK
jgi:hypothetical protein